jgi:hypothetical protein
MKESGVEFSKSERERERVKVEQIQINIWKRKETGSYLIYI